ncbi:hypothetical protein COY05_00750 [Candidatus Peregrinibacteria bacterium CG_4_10_14_0_2_um_filter_38_24]|nr:MAG: hypothetical protein COY05_00750 [Candidatus Peregrinibacteria bacterium CG_4_10_14_0_2_um_filter_38_24]
MYITSLNRIAILARQPEQIFHSQDLGRLWNINNPNTLNTLLKRYKQKGLLFRIYKGLYSLLLPDKLDPLLLGIKALHGYSYVSTETILIEEGLITQMDYQYTFISNSSRNFQIGQRRFRSRKLQDKYLYNPAGIIEKNGILMASPLRALADLFYFNPNAYLDGSKMIDFKELNKLEKAIGYPITKNHHAHSA